jgi:hypothetical protein
MSEQTQVIGGPAHGLTTNADKEYVCFPVDENLVLIKGKADPYAMAVYHFEQSEGIAVYKFRHAQRHPDPTKNFSVEFIDGPMQGKQQFGHAAQLYDMTLRLSLGEDHKPLREGSKVGAIAEYKRREVNGIWKMTLVRIVEAEAETEQFENVIGEHQLTQQLGIFTTEQLARELASRESFLGAILMYPGEVKGSNWHLTKGTELIMMPGRQVNRDGLKLLLRSALETMEQ